MKYFDWDEEKNEWLKDKRGIGFENVKSKLEIKDFLDIIDNPNKIKYPNQKMFVIVVDDYVHLVPFVEDEEKIFLKTIYPSRKLQKKYLKGKI
mgnify:FL=1